MGDMNDITHPTEAKGFRQSLVSCDSALAQFCQEQGMIDLGFVGLPFTWTNR